MGVGRELDSHLPHSRNRVTWVRGGELMAPWCRASVAGRRARPDAPRNAICGAFLSSVSTQRGSPAPSPGSSLQDTAGFVRWGGHAALSRRQQARCASGLGDCQAFTLWHVTVIQRIGRGAGNASILKTTRTARANGWQGEQCIRPETSHRSPLCNRSGSGLCCAGHQERLPIRAI